VVKYSKYGTFEITKGVIELTFSPQLFKDYEFPLDEADTPKKSKLTYHPNENAYSSDFDDEDNKTIKRFDYRFDKKTCQWRGERKVIVHETYTKNLKEAIGFYCSAKTWK